MMMITMMIYRVRVSSNMLTALAKEKERDPVIKEQEKLLKAERLAHRKT